MVAIGVVVALGLRMIVVLESNRGKAKVEERETRRRVSIVVAAVYFQRLG